jgi:hypothetical protein
MAAVYSRNLYRVSGQTSGDGTISVPVPTGKVMVVTHVDVYSGDLGGPTIFFQDGTTGGTWWVRQGPAADAVSAQWQGREVWTADGFEVRVDSGTWDVAVNGFMLDLP